MLPSASALACRREERVQKAFSVDHHEAGDARLSHSASGVYGAKCDYVITRRFTVDNTSCRYPESLGSSQSAQGSANGASRRVTSNSGVSTLFGPKTAKNKTSSRFNCSNRLAPPSPTYERTVPSSVRPHPLALLEPLQPAAREGVGERGEAAERLGSRPFISKLWFDATHRTLPKPLYQVGNAE